MSQAFRIIGTPLKNGVLIVGDHASNFVPETISLGVSEVDLRRHIAWDIGVAEVAAGLCEAFDFAAFLGGVSRLVVDFNRYRDNSSVIPLNSDGIEISGNQLTEVGRDARLATYFDPYHAALGQLLQDYKPALIMSLHSFTPILESTLEQARPWDVGVLYNDYEIASLWAIDALNAFGLNVGDQLPYSGKHLNATMNHHAERNKIPYFGIEMRQDLVADQQGIDRFVQILGSVCNKITKKLAD